MFPRFFNIVMVPMGKIGSIGSSRTIVRSCACSSSAGDHHQRSGDGHDDHERDDDAARRYARRAAPRPRGHAERVVSWMVKEMP